MMGAERREPNDPVDPVDPNDSGEAARPEPARLIPPADPLDLAEGVAAGRLTMAAAEARIRASAASTPAAEQALDEFRSLLRGLAAVGTHAAAWRDDQAGTAAGSATLDRSGRRPGVKDGRLTRRMASRRGNGIRVVVGGIASVAAIVIVAVIVASLRLAPAPTGPGGAAATSPSEGNPSPAYTDPTRVNPVLSSGGSTSGVPSGEPSAEPSTTGAAGLPPLLGQPLTNAGSLALWSVGVVPGKLTLWRWDPAHTGAFVDTVDVPVWTATATTYRVLASPDGLRFAVVEHAPGDPASHDRVRVFNTGGSVQWTSPAGMPRTIDMAWSADGSRLALGSEPTPWTVISFGDASNSVATRTYHLTTDAAYRLLGFSADDTWLYGYETSGEAEFWQKPMRLDLAGDGSIQNLDAFPSGAAALADSNATGPTDQIAPGTGAVVALNGTAKGTPEWIVRTGTVDQAVEVSPSAHLIWAGPQTLAELTNDAAGGSSGSGFALALAPVSPTSGGVSPMLNLGGGTTGGGEFASLAGSRGGYVLAMLDTSEPPAGASGSGIEAVLVDAATGQVGVGLAPAGVPTGTEFTFAGWLP